MLTFSVETFQPECRIRNGLYMDSDLNSAFYLGAHPDPGTKTLRIRTDPSQDLPSFLQIYLMHHK